MASATQIETECFKMDIKLSEFSRSIEDSIAKVECTEHANETCKDGIGENKKDEDTGEKTGQIKKRFRSEKQKERTRQYKKKIRRAKKQMMREKKLVERNSNDGYITDDNWSPKPQGPETGCPSTRLLQTSENKMKPESTRQHENLQENLAEQVSLQLRPAVNLTKETEVHVGRYEYIFLENMTDESLSLKPQAPQTGCATAQLLSQTEDKTELEEIVVDKDLSKENPAETFAVQLSPIRNLKTHAAVDADTQENIIPDNNTNGDSLSLKLQEFESGYATGALLSLSADKIEVENTGMENNPSRETLVEQRPALNLTTEAAVYEARHKDLILDNNTGDRQDMFGILSVYANSSVHSDYDKDSVFKTSPANDFGYVYFSMKDFWK